MNATLKIEKTRATCARWFVVSWIAFAALSFAFTDWRAIPWSSAGTYLQFQFFSAIVAQGALFSVAVTSPAYFLAKASALRTRKHNHHGGSSILVLLLAILSASVVVLFTIDQQVYDAFHTHINALMIRQTMQQDFFAQSGIPAAQVYGHIFHFMVLSVCLVLVALFISRLNFKIPKRYWQFTATIAISSVAFDKGLGALSHDQNHKLLEDRIPLYLSFSPARTGFKSIQSSVSSYPTKSYQGKITNPKNILFLVLESFSASALTPELMPYSYALGSSGFIGLRHHSGSNCTQSGLFSLYYGSNDSLIPESAAKEKGAYPLRWLKSQGYRTEYFSPVSIGWLGMDTHMINPSFEFVDVLQSELPIDQRDRITVERYLKSVRSGSSQPRFSALFFQSTHHNYYSPADFQKYQPIAPDIITGSMHDNHQGLVNRYHNAVNYVDSLIRQVVEDLKLRNQFENTIIVIVGDHGEAFFEHGRYVHASDLTFSQVGTPLIIHGIDSLKGQAHYATGHEQIMPTVLEAIAPGINSQDSGTGRIIGSANSYPLLVAQCMGFDSDQSQWAAIYADYKVPLQIENGQIVPSKPLDLNDAPIDKVLKTESIEHDINSRQFVSSATKVSDSDALKSFLQQTNCANLPSKDGSLKLCTHPVSWNQAKNWCESHKMTLATKVSASEAIQLHAASKELLSDAGIWVGARYDPKTKLSAWESGEDLGGGWEGNEDPFGIPFKGNRGEDGECVATSGNFEGKWAREQCWLPKPFACRQQNTAADLPQFPYGKLEGTIKIKLSEKSVCEKGLVILVGRREDPNSEIPDDGLLVYQGNVTCNTSVEITDAYIPVGNYRLSGVFLRDTIDDCFFDILYHGLQCKEKPWSRLNSIIPIEIKADTSTKVDLDFGPPNDNNQRPF